MNLLKKELRELLKQWDYIELEDILFRVHSIYSRLVLKKRTPQQLSEHGKMMRSKRKSSI